jgi:two-component system LytT family sensor kinase
MAVVSRVSAWWSALPLFWRFQLGGWLAFAVLSFPLKVAALGSVGYVLVISLVREPLGLLWTTGFRWVYRRLELTSASPWRLAGWVLLVCLVAGFIDGMIWDFLSRQWVTLQPRRPMEGMFYPRSLVFCAWSLLFFGIKDHLATRERALALARAETKAREAELKMLRAQVSPHFLFNAFNTILAGLDRDPQRLAPVVQSLADYFRYSLSSRHDGFVPLREEFDAVVDYLTVEKARFRETLVVETFLDPAVRDVRVPGVILQPMLENALKYGHQTSPTPLVIRLRVGMAPGERVLVEVANSGQWVEPPAVRAREDVGGNGLSSLRRRLELLYPSGSVRLPWVETAGGLVVVRLELPRYHAGDPPFPS